MRQGLIRIGAIVRKEFRHLGRDPRMLVAVVLTSTRTVLRGAAPALSADDVVELFLHGALADTEATSC